MKEYDFGLNWSEKTREVFISSLRANCQKLGLSFLWISDENIRETIKKLESNEMRVKFLLDTEATYNKSGDLYARICYAVKDSGGVIINDPDRARLAVDKSVMHYELINKGIDTPYSVIVRNWEPKTFKLSQEEKKRLGSPFIIKPACGYSRQGVVDGVYGSIREIASARNFDPGDNFLLQEKINPVDFSGKRAWFRVFHVFDKIIPCWWDDRSSIYEHLTDKDFQNRKLYPLAKIVSKIAEITRMVWFSTEIAIQNCSEQKKFVVIDYLNDQCDMTAQSKDKTGVPDPVVNYIAARIVEFANKIIKGEPLNKNYALLFKSNIELQMKGLGGMPKPLTQ